MNASKKESMKDYSESEYKEVSEEIEQGGDSTATETEPIDRRDEVGEVRKMSSKDTNRLRLWRFVVTGVLLLTAFAITFTTYTLLEKQEDENFQMAVSLFSSSSFFLLKWIGLLRTNRSYI